MTMRPTQPTATPRQRGFSALGARVEAAALAPGLYVVATPIGNLGDVSLRALTTLAAADAILAEDTRVTRRLLDRYDISAPLIAYHEHNAAEMRPRALARLAEGQALALVSDAGTPLVSDPGYKLVVEAAAAGATVFALPGPCAAIAALTTAALPTDRFFFEGFLPAKSAARRERIAALATIPATLVFYESPGRLAESLADLAGGLGPRPAAVARELTKLHEETRRATLTTLADHYAAADAPKGEIVVVVGPPPPAAKPAAETLDAMILDALASLSVKDAAAAVAVEAGLPRREVYARALRLARTRR